MTTEHRTIVVVDVAHFTNPARTLLHLGTVHQGLYDILRTAFEESGIAWKACHVEDRGDGAMILVPPEFSKARLADQWPDRLLAGLRDFNATHSPEARIQLRVALHAGEIHADTSGVISSAVNLAFRILDATAAKTALASSDGTLALIVSDWFFHNVIRHQPDARPDLFQQVAVSVKETEAIAWLRLPEGLTTPSPQPTAGPSRLVGVVDAAVTIPILNDDGGRRLVLDQLRPELANAVPYFPQSRLHLLALIRTCMQYPGALADLVEVVRQLEGDSPQVSRFAAAVDNALAPTDGPAQETQKGQLPRF